jgi:acyl-CoA thioesterase FadM
MLFVLFNAKRKKLINPLEESVITLKVLLNDLDINRHLNNGRYLSLMDLGRLDLIIRTGLLKSIFKNKWYPLVGSANIRFLKSLKLFQSFNLRTQLIFWDEKWFYIEQRFESDNKLVAIGIVKTLIRGPLGNIPTSQVIQSIGFNIESPQIPEEIKIWKQFEQTK